MSCSHTAAATMKNSEASSVFSVSDLAELFTGETEDRESLEDWNELKKKKRESKKKRRVRPRDERRTDEREKNLWMMIKVPRKRLCSCQCMKRAFLQRGVSPDHSDYVKDSPVFLHKIFYDFIYSGSIYPWTFHKLSQFTDMLRIEGPPDHVQITSGAVFLEKLMPNLFYALLFNFCLVVF